VAPLWRDPVFVLMFILGCVGVTGFVFVALGAG
jgi:hypothetical protein